MRDVCSRKGGRGLELRSGFEFQGCITIFPQELTTKYYEVAYISIFLGCLLILCLILSIVLLVLVCTKRYKGGQGPECRPHHHLWDPEQGNVEVEAELPALWTRRGRRSAIGLPPPSDELNFLNARVFSTSEARLEAGEERPPSQIPINSDAQHREDYEEDGGFATFPNREKARRRKSENKVWAPRAPQGSKEKKTEKIYKNDEFRIESEVELPPKQKKETDKPGTTPKGKPEERKN
jgi:hypothetical protein